MDEFYEYWELIPENKKYESIGKEIVKYKRNLYDPETNSRDLSENVIEFFQHNLLDNPYPTYNIIYHIIDLKDHEKNQLLEDVIFNTIIRLIDLIIEYPNQLDKKFKLLNLLSNIFIPDSAMRKMQSIIIPALFELKEIRNLLDDDLYFALLSRNSLTLLNQYMDYEHSRILEKFECKSFFLKCHYQKRHWIDTILKSENDELVKQYFNHTLYNTIGIFKIIFKLNSCNFFNNASLRKDFALIDSSVIQNKALQLSFSELSRQHEIAKFVKSHSSSLSNFDMSKNFIMTQLLSLQINFQMENYDEILNVLKTNHNFNMIQLELSNQFVCEVAKTEIQLLNEYMIIKLYLMNILQGQGSTDDSFNHIRSLLKTINDGNVLFRILQIVFTLFFVRYEHIRKTKWKVQRSESISTNSSSSKRNSQSTGSDVFVEGSINGFVCNKKSLKNILNSMRLFLMSLDITEAYKNSNDDLKERFSKMLETVDNTLWRLDLIEEEESKQKDIINIGRIKNLLVLHNDSAKNSMFLKEKTSDEEKIESKRKFHRKKLRKRLKLKNLSSEDNDEDSECNNQSIYVTTGSQVTENSEIQTKFISKTPDSIIAKMLMSSESLVALNVSKNNFENVEQIIKKYNLQNSDIANEVAFIKNFEDALNTLNSILQKYYSITMHQKVDNGDPIKIDRIKSYTEAGFEIVKLTDVLDTFCSMSVPSHINKHETLLDKKADTNISIFKHLMITKMIDFMISLPGNYEVNHTFYKYILKKWNLAENERGQYFTRFLRNTIKVVGFLESQKKGMTIEELLNNEIFSLDPSKFKIQYANREKFKNLFELNTECLNDETVLEETMQKLESFNSDTNYFSRIVHYIRSIHLMIELKNSEYVDIDTILRNTSVFDLIGNIIFVNQYHPNQLKNYAFNANINLFHSLAVAAAGEINPPHFDNSEDEKLLSLFHLSEMGEKSKTFLTDDEKKTPQVYQISNTDIVYAIKNGGSFLVAYLVKEIQNFEYKSLKFDDPNYFERLRDLKPIENLMKLYDNNATLAALHYDHVNMRKLLRILQTMSLREKLCMLSCLSEKNWEKNKAEFNELKDFYLETLMEEENADIVELLENIGSIQKCSILLLKYFKCIQKDDEIERLLGWLLNADNSKKISKNERKELEEWRAKLSIYQNILRSFLNDTTSNKTYTWINIMELAENDLFVLVNYLVNLETNLEQCYQLLKIYPINDENEEIFKILTEALNKKELNDEHAILWKIIHTFSPSVTIEFFEYSLSYVNNLQSMVYIVEKLKNKTKNPMRYQKFQLSCKIIENLDGDDDAQLWTLAPYPLIILEQLLMNSKIEILTIIVKELREFLHDHPSCDVCNAASRNYQIGEIIIFDLDAHHKDVWITNDCIDFLLKIYAAKALDFQIIDIHSNLTSTTQSIDSIHTKTYQIPKEIPPKEEWMPDNEATSCMCCKKSKFSLLNRRHHCRRCGRVICGECSRRRVLLPEKYNKLLVRCCDDCYTQIMDEKQQIESGPIEKARSAEFHIEWKLTANPADDQLIRDEFTFEYSPNVALCIAILTIHTINTDFTNFLLFHCHRLELLLRPFNGRINPEIDISLVASMLKYLATTAKLFGDNEESNVIIEKADMILKLAENECDSIFSKDPFNSLGSNVSIRNIINELIKAENWGLASELAVKWDPTSKSGIFSSWAVSLIRGGHYALAREKMSFALQQVIGSCDEKNEALISAIMGNEPINSLNFSYKRPIKSSPLLNEIIEVLESTASKQSVVEVQIKTSTTSIFSIFNDKPKHVKTSMENLKKIMEGDYGTMTRRISEKFDWNPTDLLKSPYFIESFFYLINYGSDGDILTFLMRNKTVKFALRYALMFSKKISHDMFAQCIFTPVVKAAKLGDFFDIIRQNDENFSLSQNYIFGVCKFLERKKAFHVLYQIQLLTHDYIRAALTSIKFYLHGSGNYNELHEKARHLVEAKNHLQTELERVESGTTVNDDKIKLKWDIKSINTKINIISLQLEVSKYLAQCECDGLPTLDIMPKLFMDKVSLKTLLNDKNPNEKNQVAILLLICGHSVESAFGLSYRIIQECSLNSEKIYSTCTKYLARDVKRLIEVEKLINCIKTNSSCTEHETENMCDELVAMAVEIGYTKHQSYAKIQIDQLIKLISSKTMKIQCYINSNQLKTAFVQCASINNLDYIKRIMKQAEITRQENIRRLCEKKLMHPSLNASMTGSFNSTTSDNIL